MRLSSHAASPAALIAALLVSAVSSPATAQVYHDPDGKPWIQRTDIGPDAEAPGWFYDLGVTGLRVRLEEEQPTQLVVAFYDQPNRDHAGYGADARLAAMAVVAFILSIPEAQLAITGREQR
ncbi:hypothetical protein Poly30_04450 [Planctomycetes bacterium Poly30]|uniref:Uncharacterized protein n=1 Tax=Saltatorellus ferox TaxID=2528018 RepID=A0A518ELI4_9BACT|nr:hypothetical protein Poly30_04450 [Planctomycetes bacterium Poly30]